MKSLKGSETAKNLMKAFAGESQARTRYTYYAGIAKKENYIQIYNIFTEIAEQEKEHAKIFYRFLLNDFQNEEIMIEASYPVDFFEETGENLKAAAKGEKEEWVKLYPMFAKKASEEGFIAISEKFRQIASIEKYHEEKFESLLKSLNDSSIFIRDEKTLWKCNNCGYIYESKEAPKVCPVCMYPQGFFEAI